MFNVIEGLGGKCIDVADANSENGTSILIWDQNDGFNQMWEFDGDFIVSALDKNKVLDIEGGVITNGTKIILWERNGDANQRWNYNPSDGVISSVLDPNKCIDVRASENKNGTIIQIWDKNGGANQKWNLIKKGAKQSVRVPGFLPSKNGLPFNNYFDHVPDNKINFNGIMMNIGDAANGLCGGMIYTVRDLFEAGIMPPTDPTPPTSGILFDYIVKRLWDSFNLPEGFSQYLILMSPDTPNHEKSSGPNSLLKSYAKVAIDEEWPKIKSDLDSGKLSVMALVKIRSYNPFDMGHNHQVLAYGYDLEGPELKILIYDPNYHGNDTIELSLNIANSKNHFNISASVPIGEEIYSFFRSNYKFSSPPSTFPPVIADPKMTVKNNTKSSQVIRVFRADDQLLLISLTAGEFTLDDHVTIADWIFPPGYNSVKVTANNRLLGTAMPGDTLTVESSSFVTVRNVTSSKVKAKFYKSDDMIMLATLPLGEKEIEPNGGEVSFSIPTDVPKIKLLINKIPFFPSTGDVVIFNP